jgi:5-methylcytosine-specific restriction enzyme A
VSAMRPCLDCGVPTRATRCPSCQRAWQRPRQRRQDARRPTAAQRGYDATYQRLRAIVLADDPPCYRCGAPASTVDHILPLSLGGTNTLDNLRPACGRCNFGRAVREHRR